MTTLNDFAPYPEREEDATAEALAKHMTVDGYRHACRSVRLMREADQIADADQRVAAMRTYWLNSSAFTAEYAAVRLFRALQNVDPELADGIAREIWSTWEGGPEVGEFLHDWLTGYGINPDEVEQAANGREAA